MATIQSALRDEIKVEAQTFYNLLNLCDGLGDKGIHVGTPKPCLSNEPLPSDNNDNTGFLDNTNALETIKNQQVLGGDVITLQQRKECAFIVKGHMDRLKLPLIETAYTALIRILCRTGDLDDAESILGESEKCEQCKPRLRLYSPLLVAYADKGKSPYKRSIGDIS